jgi:hypothetical protein
VIYLQLLRSANSRWREYLTGWIEMATGGQGFIIALLCAMYAPIGFAQAAGHNADSSEPSSSDDNTHLSHRNVLSLFAGVTHAGRRENGLALGVGYERLLNDFLAIGVLAEHTFGDADISVYAVPFSYRFDRWKFYVAPGIEESDKHGTESLVRLSAEYAFEAGSWEVSPQLAIDFVDDDEVLILGVVFGWGF